VTIISISPFYIASNSKVTFKVKYTRVSLSVGTDNEVLRYWYKGGVSLLVHTGPLYQYSVQIRRYVQINVVRIVNQTMGFR